MKIQAIFEDGVFKLLQPVLLPNGTKVSIDPRLVVEEPIDMPFPLTAIGQRGRFQLVLLTIFPEQ